MNPNHFAISARKNSQRIFASTVLSVALVSMSFFASGCPKGSKSLATASATVAHALTNAQQAVAIGQSSGVISAKDAAAFNEYVAKVAEAGLIIDQGIRQNESASTLSPKVNVFLDAFQSLNTQGLLSIKDPKTQLAVATALTGAESAIAIIAAQTGK